MNPTREYVLTRLTAEERKAMNKRLLAQLKVRLALFILTDILSILYLAWRTEYGWGFFDGILIGIVIGVLYLLTAYTIGECMLWRPPTWKEIEVYGDKIR